MNTYFSIFDVEILHSNIEKLEGEINYFEDFEKTLHTHTLTVDAYVNYTSVVCNQRENVHNYQFILIYQFITNFSLA